MTKKTLIWLLAAALANPVVAGLLSSDAGDSQNDAPPESTLDDPRIEIVAPEEAGVLAVGMTPPQTGVDRRAAPRGNDFPVAPQVTPQSMQDPLASTLRGLVNVAPGGGASGGNVAAPGPGARATGASAAPSERDEALEARIAAVKESLAAGLESALSPEVDEHGKVRFSVLGVEGFHADASGGKVSLGFRDSSLPPVVRSPASNPWGGAGDPAQRPAQADQGERLALFRVVFMIWDFITHPATLGILAFAFLMRLALAVGRIKQMR